MKKCDTCGRRRATTPWACADSNLSRALESIGYKTIKNICAACSTCVICREPVTHRQGAPAVGPFPAVHSACLRQDAELSPEQRALRDEFTRHLKRALSGGRSDA